MTASSRDNQTCSIRSPLYQANLAPSGRFNSSAPTGANAPRKRVRETRKNIRVNRLKSLFLKTHQVGLTVFSSLFFLPCLILRKIIQRTNAHWQEPFQKKSAMSMPRRGSFLSNGSTYLSILSHRNQWEFYLPSERFDKAFLKNSVNSMAHDESGSKTIKHFEWLYIIWIKFIFDDVLAQPLLLLSENTHKRRQSR